MASPRLVVFGGNGWVGSAIITAALSRGASVTSVSRSGAPSTHLGESHRSLVEWRALPADAVAGGNAAGKAEVSRILEGATGVVSAVGSFGEPPLNSQSLFQMNGVANANIAQRAFDCGVPHFAYISAHQYPIAKQTVLNAYYNGKMHAEDTIRAIPFDETTILRPGFITGTRGNIPLHAIGAPLAAVFRSSPVKSVRSALPPFVGDFLETPIHVDDVAASAVAGGLGRLPASFKDAPYLGGDDMVEIAAAIR